MRKILLDATTKTTMTPSQTKLSATQQSSTKKNTINLEPINKILRKKRSQNYLSNLSKLDTGNHVNMQDMVNTIKTQIEAEFPFIDCISNILIGIIAPCYLGDNYEVHILDFQKDIIEHYVHGQPLPYGLESARSTAMSQRYAYIEVYEHQFCLISEDGSVSIVKR